MCLETVNDCGTEGREWFREWTWVSKLWANLIRMWTDIWGVFYPFSDQIRYEYFVIHERIEDLGGIHHPLASQLVMYRCGGQEFLQKTQNKFLKDRRTRIRMLNQEISVQFGYWIKHVWIGTIREHVATVSGIRFGSSDSMFCSDDERKVSHEQSIERTWLRQDSGHIIWNFGIVHLLPKEVAYSECLRDARSRVKKSLYAQLHVQKRKASELEICRIIKLSSP